MSCMNIADGFYELIHESYEIIHEKFMSTWIWIKGKAWTYEYEYAKIYEPVNFISDKSMNPWISFYEPLNMNTDIAVNPWIWICIFPWTREYEYGEAALWTFKSSYSSRIFMNHAMNSMNCNTWNFDFCSYFKKKTLYFLIK